MCINEKLTRPYGVNVMIFVRSLQQRILNNNIIMLKLRCNQITAQKATYIRVQSQQQFPKVYVCVFTFSHYESKC